jgi:hypothetical protein
MFSRIPADRMNRGRVPKGAGAVFNPLSIANGLLWLDTNDSGAVATTAASVTAGSDLSNAAWTKTATTIAADTSDTQAPDATQTADKATTTNASNAILQNVSNVSTTLANTFTFYAKFSNVQWLVLGTRSGTAANFVYFDIQNGAVGTVGANMAGASITDAGNGWWRCQATRNVQAGTEAFIFAPSSTDGTITGGAGHVVYYCGASVNQVRVSALTNKVSSVVWSNGTANSQPGLVTSPNAGANFNGAHLIQSTEAAVVNAFKDQNPLTIFYVTKLANADAVGYFLGGSKASAAAGFRLYLQNSTGAGVYTYQYFADGGSLQTASSASGTVDTNRNVLEFLDTGSNITFLSNGVATIGSTAYTGGTSTTTIVSIGCFDNNGSPASFLSGVVNEILIYSRNLSAGERSQVRQYLGNKWAVAVTP